MDATSFTLDQLSRSVEGTLLDPAHGSIRIHQVAALGDADTGSITFVESAQLLPQALATPCAAVIVPGTVTSLPRPAIAVRNPRLAFARLLRLFHPPPPAAPGIHPTAAVAADTTVDPTASVGPYVILERGVVVGAGARIQAHCRVGPGSVVGDRSWLYPGVRVGARVRIGADVIVHSGTSLGDLSPTPTEATYGLTIGDEVEIGARARLESGDRRPTVIGAGSKCDNFVLVGAGAAIGRACILVSQSCVEPGGVVEDGCVIAAQGLVLRDRRVSARSIVAARSMVGEDAPAGQVVSGAPARPHREELRAAAAVQKMAELFGRLLDLERRP